MVLETGGFPLALRGTKHCEENREQLMINGVLMPTVADEGELGIMEEQLLRGKNLG